VSGDTGGGGVEIDGDMMIVSSKRACPTLMKRTIPLVVDSRNKSGNGVGMEWEWSGNGVGMEWEWSGNGVGMEWEWSGNGVGMEWEWI
jgi:hypothetical protein